MEQFDLLTAIELLPRISGQEKVTQSLIDNIEYYSSVIDENSQQLLINFVLKTRLSSVGKFYLKSNYDNVDCLIKDMEKCLLPRKCPTHIQIKLINCRQRNRSIEAFGAEIDDLLYDLTLAQSENDKMKYKILQPINEKLAIRCFADGLNNSRISIIIIARNFKYLKDAIQAALDENSIMSYGSQNVVYKYNDMFKMSKISQCVKGQNIMSNFNESTNEMKSDFNFSFSRDKQTCHMVEECSSSNKSFKDCNNFIPRDKSLDLKSDREIFHIDENYLNIANKNIFTLEESKGKIKKLKSKVVNFKEEKICEPVEESLEKSNYYVDIIIKDSIDKDIKDKKCIFSNQGLCVYIPIKSAIFVKTSSLLERKRFIKDFEVFCKEINIKGLIIDEKWFANLQSLINEYKVVLPRLIKKSPSEIMKKDYFVNDYDKNYYDSRINPKTDNISGDIVKILEHRETNMKGNYFEKMFVDNSYDKNAIGIT